MHGEGQKLTDSFPKGSSKAQRTNGAENAKYQSDVFGTIDQPKKLSLLVEGRPASYKRYTFERLKECEIRLIRLTPGDDWPFSSSQTLKVDLQRFDLDKAPEFLAISYTWGSLKDTEPVIVEEDYFLSITKSLAQALRRLRSRHGISMAPVRGVRYVWADQLCIDQKDLSERNSQVGMMGDIYGKAFECAVWLGEEDETTDTAFGLIHRFDDVSFEQLAEVRGPQRLAKIREYFDEHIPALPPIGDAAWTALARILNRKWFSRLWALQEAVAAKSVLFLCGQFYCGQDSLHSAAFYLGGQRTEAGDSHPRGHDTSDVTIQLRRVRYRGSRGRGVDPLLTVMDFSRATFQCTEPHDRVYALLGLGAKEEKLQISVDYRKPLHKLYTETTRAIINCYRSLAAFGALGEATRGVTPGLPSWVPDWSTRGNPFPVEVISRSKDGYSAFFNSCKGYRHKVRPTGQENELAVGGRTVDRIEDVITSALEEQDFYAPDAAASSVKALLSQALTSLHRHSLLKGLTTIEAQREAKTILLKTITARASRESDLRKFQLHLDKQAIRQWGYEDSGEILDALEESLANGDPGHEKTNLIECWLKELTPSAEGCVNHKLVILQERLLALCPSSCQKGDLITMLHGSTVPIVLRRTGDRYQVMGQCYVEGIMWGEAVDWGEDEGDVFTLA
jgi:hypothetical protein